MQKIADVLSKYLPGEAVETCSEWIVSKNIHLKITRERASKYGDYRPMPAGRGHRITVNHDLNPYSFLVTFVHEVAHLETYTKYSHRHDPHGKEWKHEFRQLLQDFINREIFPGDIKNALLKYIQNPAASSCSDHDLLRALKKYDQRSEEVFHLEDLPENSVFSMYQSNSQLVFKKGHKIRTRFQCLELNSKRIYFVSAIADVVKIIRK